MKWYQVEEQAAGTKRLFAIYWIHKVLGRNIVKFLVYFITFFAFCTAKKIRNYSAKYLSIVGEKPSLKNQYKHFLEYSLSLLDKMEVFSDTFDRNRISFVNDSEKLQLEQDYPKGVFFICSHLGNVDVMRTLFKDYPTIKVNVFLAKDQCKNFNSFIKAINKISNVTTYPVEDINITTSIEIKEKLSNGEIAIMAGDRTSPKAQNFTTKLFNHNVEFPLGTFKFAQLMNCPTYFICILKDENDNYKIYTKKFIPIQDKEKSFEKMKNEYTKFLEEKTHLAPFQFFHFYDLFSESKNL